MGMRACARASALSLGLVGLFVFISDFNPDVHSAVKKLKYTGMNAMLSLTGQSRGVLGSECAKYEEKGKFAAEQCMDCGHVCVKKLS